MSQISVIVPVYRVEKYIHRCVDSILAQTFTNFELILVDDGSTDNCGVICDEYAQKDSRIVVIHQANGGLSAARNAGIDWAFANSDSEWLAFVDSDDWVHPQFLELLLHYAIVGKTQISICNFTRTQCKGKNETIGKVLFDKCSGDQFYYENDLIGTVAWNKLYKKELFTDYRYPVNKLHEDEFLTYKLISRAQNIMWIDVPLYYYYENMNSITHSAWNIRRLDKLDALDERVDFYKDKSYDEWSDQLIRRIVVYCYKNICNEVQKNDDNSQRNIKQICKKLNRFVHKRQGDICRSFNRYDLLTCWILCLGNMFLCRWIVQNEFEPIQNILRKIKNLGGKE